MLVQVIRHLLYMIDFIPRADKPLKAPEEMSLHLAQEAPCDQTGALILFLPQDYHSWQNLRKFK